MNSELEKPMTSLKGVGQKRAEVYEKIGVKTFFAIIPATISTLP